jgi:hypothetical protein
MDKTIRKFASFNAMKAEEYRAWQALTPADRLNAAAELSIGLYSMESRPSGAAEKRPSGTAKEPFKNVPARLQRTLVRLQQPQR